ncbi:hypothetical protein ACFYUJ_30385 [Streptomyces sp. NPDC004520]|uniref:hypothetical protein n=1 Tax=Streptomyces sp. NPDC004520 TaxID=3364702 RepID=UPI003688F27F
MDRLTRLTAELKKAGYDGEYAEPDITGLDSVRGVEGDVLARCGRGKALVDNDGRRHAAGHGRGVSGR